jgi:uncharacterized membrane-anchored protein
MRLINAKLRFRVCPLHFGKLFIDLSIISFGDIFMQTQTISMLPKKHLLFETLVTEFHSRRFPSIQGEVTLSQVTILHDNSTKASQISHLQALANVYHVSQPRDDTVCYYQDLGELDIRWEYHTEFSTYTFIRFNKDELPFSCSAWSVLPSTWCISIPGLLIAATHIDIQRSMPNDSQLQQLFAGHAVSASFIAENNAEVWTSFKPGSDNFDRILMVNYELNGSQTGRSLRCLLEISSYRMMALLSFPLTKKLLPIIAAMEKKLANITIDLNHIKESNKSQTILLNKLSELSAKLENLIADNQYRFDASNAYFDLVLNRLDELKEQNISGVTTISDFLSRRLTPAIRTGSSIKKRMLNLSNRIEKSSDLLRTKISLGLEEQNQNLLKALNRRSYIQLRLHQLVESVSMIAISYYVIQMIGYMLVLPTKWLDIVSKDLVIAFSVPIVITGVWYVLHKLKRKWREEKF